MKALVYHNPRCGKSRGVLDILEKNKIEFEVKEYLKSPLTKEEILNLAKLLKVNVSQMIRTKEEVYQNLKLAQKSHADDDLSQVIVQNPILLERPIVVIGKKAVIARPPENVLAII